MPDSAHRSPTLATTVVLIALTALTGCASQQKPARDYSAFQQSKPTTLLVLPAINPTKEVHASHAVISSSIRPLSEAGYYVIPPALAVETFRANGMPVNEDVHQLPAAKLREVFGADAALYLQIERYGTDYRIITSESRVTLQGKLVDLRTGSLLWDGKATASSAEQQNSSGGGVAGLLIRAVMEQVVGTLTDAAYNYAVIANDRLLGFPRPEGVLPGPRLAEPKAR